MHPAPPLLADRPLLCSPSSRLAAQLEELKAKKEAQSKANGTKREQLAKLPSHLKAILKAASPLQDVLGRAEENLLPTGSKARFLPKPLYIVFSHITAYCTMSSGDYAVNVVGDVALAKDLFTQGSLKTLDVNLDEVEQDEDEADDEEEAKRSTGNTDEEALAANQGKLMEAFPLNIEVIITTEGGQKVTLQFYYLHNLEVVTVKSSEEKTHDNILSCLYPSDDGLELPHARALYTMDKFKMTPFAEHIAKVGRAYRWAQTICGLQATELGGAEVPSEIKRQGLICVLQDIRAKVASHASLKTQLTSLVNQEYLIPDDFKEWGELFPLEPRTKFSEWKSIDRDTPNQNQFTAVFTSSDCSLRVNVTVPKLYPAEPPLFKMTSGKGEKSGSFMGELGGNLAAIESEVNIYHEELLKTAPRHLLLTLQLRRTHMCFDVFCETQKGAVAGAVGKMFIRGVRGRDRLRPYMYDPQQKLFVHRDGA